MFVTIINDCTDSNAKGRQFARVSSLFGCPIQQVDVHHNLKNGGNLEAAGNLIDVLDTTEGRSVVLVNTAPRNGDGKRWPNGTPFCYFWRGETLVVSTVSGYTLSLVKKFGIVDSLRLLDVPTVVESAIEAGKINSEIGKKIIKTQFRSLEFSPRVARWIFDGVEVPFTEYSFTNVPDAPRAVWCVDNFGNCKTTLVAEDIGFEHGKVVKTAAQDLHCYERLKDVPEGEEALIIGSSGYGGRQFLEIVVQGVPASEHFGISVGSEV